MTSAVESNEVHESTMERLRALIRQETGPYCLKNPAAAPAARVFPSMQKNASTNRSSIAASGLRSYRNKSAAWRRKLCDWCYQVVDHFEFDREAVGIAMNYLDRYAAVRRIAMDTTDFQLLAVTCLFLALKVHGRSEANTEQPQKLGIDTYVVLSKDTFSREDIQAMEEEILQSLCWYMNPPTVVSFISLYLQVCSQQTNGEQRRLCSEYFTSLFDVARYLSEIAVCVSSIACSYPPSVVAYASILAGTEALQPGLCAPEWVQNLIQAQILSATGRSVTDRDVVRACDLLRRSCPDLFSQRFYSAYGVHNVSNGGSRDSQRFAALEDGKVSPICVMEVTGRKRDRDRDE